ncbi:peptide deformylase [Sulfurovum sp.]|uniref:peptide deformylase n=1 Tax=Sulfurovum sp. TaxID=1969726 RepID=UPI0025EA3E6C|nr:peptide deformylase [Sulfurovum sp.]
MVQKLVVYPDDRMNCTSTDVRSFNQTLWDVIEDMRDTMQAHDIEAMAAMQIAYPYNIILIKEGGEYHEYINPRIIKNEDLFDSEESSIHYPDVTVTIPRYGKIKLVYEDRNGKVHYEDIDNRELAATLQRKIDITFGGNILDKVDKKTREKILDALTGKGLMPKTDDVCPTFSRKDYFVSFSDKLLFLMGLSLLTPLFHFSKNTIDNIYTYDKIAFPAVIVLMIVFFFYAQYEARKYKQCSSCQIGNNIGVMIKRGVAALAFAIGAYFLVNPN